MRLFSHRIVVLVGLGLLATGCAAESSDGQVPVSPDSPDAPVLRPLDNGTPLGGHSSNGLLPLEYQSRRVDLDVLMRKPLMVAGEMNPDHAFADFISNDSGNKVFKYTIECALPKGMLYGQFEGAGLMATTESWMKFPLDLQQRRDVHTCVTTRLNPLGEHVDIWLGGPDTAKDVGSGTYGESEAVWSVDLNTDVFRFSVWPLETFTAYSVCGHSTTAMLADVKSRLCDNNGPLCDVVLRTDLATACKGSPGMGDWVCDGKPAIETRLAERDWDRMHPQCNLGAPIN